MKRIALTVSASLIALASFGASLGTAAQAQSAPAPAATAAPAPSASPAAKTTPIPGKAKATPAPPQNAEDKRVGLTGVWEIALQKSDGVVYTHFKLTQTGTALTGQYLDEDGKRYPLAGAVDGSKVRLVVSLPNGTALVFSGTQDGNTDMMGTLNTAGDLIGFTAAYRPKYKWMDNIAPGTAGMGTP